MLLASGFERMMNTVICCYHLEADGEFPKREVFPKGSDGHNLELLLNQIRQKCFSGDYIARFPAAETDIAFLQNDPQLLAIAKILPDFGHSARYYNLKVVLGEPNTGMSPDREWQKLKTAGAQVSCIRRAAFFSSPYCSAID
jgi:hypothetical protein